MPGITKDNVSTAAFAEFLNSQLERVEIISDKTWTTDRAGRAGFSDGIVDLLRNHLRQLLALVAKEPPHSLDERVFRNQKAEVLAAVATVTREEVIRRSRGTRLVHDRGVDCHIRDIQRD